MRVREKELYVGIAEVRDFMSSLGIQRGFEQDTIRKKCVKVNLKYLIFVSVLQSILRKKI